MAAIGSANHAHNVPPDGAGDLLKFRNFGKKSLTELEELLVNMNLTFGMDTSKYKLDKD